MKTYVVRYRGNRNTEGLIHEAIVFADDIHTARKTANKELRPDYTVIGVNLQRG